MPYRTLADNGEGRIEGRKTLCSIFNRWHTFKPSYTVKHFGVGCLAVESAKCTKCGLAITGAEYEEKLSIRQFLDIITGRLAFILDEKDTITQNEAIDALLTGLNCNDHE